MKSRKSNSVFLFRHEFLSDVVTVKTDIQHINNMKYCTIFYENDAHGKGHSLSFYEELVQKAIILFNRHFILVAVTYIKVLGLYLSS